MADKPEAITKRSAAGRFWEAWKRFGKRMGDIQARALLTFFYFVLLSPFALAVRWWSDPLAIKPCSAKGWRPKGDDDETPEKRAGRQF